MCRIPLPTEMCQKPFAANQPLSRLASSKASRFTRGTFPILSRDPNLSRKPQETSENDRLLKRTMVENNGQGINPRRCTRTLRKAMLDRGFCSAFSAEKIYLNGSVTLEDHFFVGRPQKRGEKGATEQLSYSAMLQSCRSSSLSRVSNAPRLHLEVFYTPHTHRKKGFTFRKNPGSPQTSRILS